VKPEAVKESLSYNDIQILRALAEESYVYGNLVGITDKTGLARDLVSSRLTVLKSLGIIETRINDKNILHWFVSPRGKQMLGDILSGQDDRKTA
jgi:DNA-binding transcriptional ArsR family regulator